MKTNTVAFLFIGQSPRPDVMDEMRLALPGFTIREYGALDGLSLAVIEAELSPASPADMLITKLSDGSGVAVSEAKLPQRLQLKLDEAARKGADAAVLMCTGSFAGLSCAVPLFTMDDVFHKNLTLPEGAKHIGLIVPEEPQRQPFEGKYAHFALPVTSAAASPYGGSENVTAAALSLKAAGADVITLDCMGYSIALAKKVSQATGLPVLTPRQETAAAIMRRADL